MRRNLRFWTRFTFEYVGVELLVVGLFLLIGLISNDWIWDEGVSGLTDFLSLLPFYLIFVAVILLVLTGPGLQMLYVSLLVSCGEPRKNVFWGLQYHRFLMIAVTSLLCACIWLLVPGEVSEAGRQCLPVIVTGLVILSAAGGLIGTAYMRWKWLGVLSIVLCSAGFGGTIGWLTISKGLDFTALPLAAGNLYTWFLPGQLAAAAVILLALDLTAQWLTLRRREVKL